MHLEVLSSAAEGVSPTAASAPTAAQLSKLGGAALVASELSGLEFLHTNKLLTPRRPQLQRRVSGRLDYDGWAQACPACKAS